MVHDIIPNSRTGAALVLSSASTYIKDSECSAPLDYHRRKASQLLEALADLLLAEARIESWYIDLGFVGCQPDENSTRG